MLTNMRLAYRKGRQAEDMKNHRKMCKKGLRKATPGSPLITVKVSAFDRAALTRCGWTIVDRTHTFASGTGASWTDSYLMSLPRKDAEECLRLAAKS